MQDCDKVPLITRRVLEDRRTYTQSLKKPRRRNLWVTDTLQRVPEARPAQPANPVWDSTASAFLFVASRVSY